ncbi:protein mono-ADP-ribosyltransferase PARP16 [Ischnura elegans]|uniref:protein mono-ADP-ribosyltransferase PARP16 n=1 Tax=Ischnura elegans TaxID=197161 RepID=UPI001ED8A3A6|nr:protein mono-ADP-ribosyltransferase PARP16 [Ischnura elegans]XP_046398622.1 protein mono-ADP-ribosyltransferase PARP16 [Ischnura elegans]
MNQRASLADETVIATPRAPKKITGENKIKNLKYLLESNIVAADIRWSIFVAACQSYRFDSCLKPYPNRFIADGNKNIDALREVVDKTNSFQLLLKKMEEQNFYRANEDVVDLLHWVLIESPEPRFKNVPKKEFDTVMRLVPSEVSADYPKLIFQMVWSPESSSEIKWNEFSKKYGSFYAYHGSRLENFHSILHYGLQQHMNKNSLFGKGIYLSSELTVSLPYSPSGYGWGRSIHGSELSCVAVCEIINHPDVKCQDKDSNPSRSITTDSIGGEVPNKYYLVVNSDLVRVRYLLVYCKQTPYRVSSGAVSWLRNHKVLVFIMSYLVMLAAIGAYHNPHAQRWWKILLRKFNL